MAKSGSQAVDLLAVPGIPRLYSVRRGMLRMCAVQLRDDSICVVSPVAGLGNPLREKAQEPERLRFQCTPKATRPR